MPLRDIFGVDISLGISGTCLQDDAKGPIIYFIEGRSLSRQKTAVLHLAGALMEHFLEGS